MPTKLPASPTTERFWLLLGWLACLGGLALRLYQLTGQSFWLDEGFTHSFTKQPASDILRLTFGVEPNPPLYYLALHYWIDLAGPTEFAIRYLSVIPSVLTIALLYRFGLDLGGPVAAAFAAALGAASPYLIWYGQEARMYALLACFGTASYIAVWRAATRKDANRGDWVRAGLLLAATLYTHFYGAFVLASAAAFVGMIWLTGARKKMLRGAILTFGVVSLSYLPWLIVNRHPGQSWRASVGLDGIVGSSLAVFAHGGFLTGPLGSWWGGLEAVVAVLGLVALWRLGPTERLGAAFLAILLVVPALGIFGLSLILPIYTDHYVTAQAPVFYVAVAAGVAWLVDRRRLFLIAPLGAALAVSLVGIWTGWHDPRFRKEDFRAAAQYIRAHDDPRDAVVLVAGFINYPFAYYFGSPDTVIPMDGTISDVGAKLTPFLRNRERVWLVVSHADAIDPQDRVRAWLADRYPEVTEQFPKSVRVYGYRIDSSRPDVPPTATATNTHYGDALVLAGFTSDNDVVPVDTLYHPPSNWLHVTLYWRVLVAPTGPYRATVRLVDGRGIWAESLSRSNDALSRTSAANWHLGDVIVEDVDVNMNPVTPSGDFALTVQVTGANGKALIPAASGEEIGRVHIAPTPAVPGWQVPLRRLVQYLAPPSSAGGS